MFLNGYRNLLKNLQTKYENPNLKFLLICYPSTQRYCNNVQQISNEFSHSKFVQTNHLRHPIEFGLIFIIN
jgi:hypothetical protein